MLCCTYLLTYCTYNLLTYLVVLTYLLSTYLLTNLLTNGKVANSWNPHWGEGGYFRIAPGQGGIDDRVISSADTHAPAPP